VHGKVVSQLVQDSPNIYKSKLIVLWGFNPVTVFNGGMVYEMLRAKEMGIPIIAIEPRYTASVELLADQWIPIRPTTDVAMMIAINTCSRRILRSRVYFKICGTGRFENESL
jgi:anaerobic selenocysteine-containing dehydrogenase